MVFSSCMPHGIDLSDQFWLNEFHQDGEPQSAAATWLSSVQSR
jgi:hypothetical protein